MNPWIEIPGGRFVLGLLSEEVDVLATASAQAARARLERDRDAGLREEREIEAKSGNVDYLRPLIARAFPSREVELAPFVVAREPVSNREWIGVSWDEAHQYAAWAGGALPNEEHWERAARGVARRLFPWGDTWGAPGRSRSGSPCTGCATRSPTSSVARTWTWWSGAR